MTRLLHANSHGFVLTYVDDGVVQVWGHEIHQSVETARETKVFDEPEYETALTICELMPVEDE